MIAIACTSRRPTVYGCAIEESMGLSARFIVALPDIRVLWVIPAKTAQAAAKMTQLRKKNPLRGRS
jgi:hypothetical protein